MTVRQPMRVLDTRSDGGPVGPGATVRIPVPTDAAGATGLLVNLTVTEATRPTSLAVADRSTSLVNTLPGRTVANLVVLSIRRADGALLANYAGAVQVVADVLGWFGPGSGHTALEPSRLLDTRITHAVVAHAVPVAAGTAVDWPHDHHDYPATDIFAACGSIAVLGRSGDAGACHIHFGLSPYCPQQEWSVRRGVIWPYPFLDDWRAGGNASPKPAITAWRAAHPGACAAAAADPFASSAG